MEKCVENRVAVFGGNGHMGRVTAQLFENLNYETLIVDPTHPDSVDPRQAIEESGAIFFSVLPSDRAAEVIEEQIDCFRPDHLILDNASVKKPLEQAYRKLNERGISICSTHPLCKHDQPLYGQKSLLMEFGHNPEPATNLAQDLYEKAGMMVVKFAFEEHDKSMAVVQLLPHLVMRSLGHLLRESGTDMKALGEIAPANFQLFVLSLWRTLIQDPNISATIISNLLKREEGQELVNGIRAAMEEVASGTSEKELAAMLGEDVSQLDQDGLGQTMNSVTTTVLERLANLRVKSITVINKQADGPGRLMELLLPLLQQGLNLNAIDSHQQEEGTRFDLGIDEATFSEGKLKKAKESLEKVGFEVIDT